MPELQINRNRPPFFAVRIAVKHEDGSTSTRDYVRGDWHIGKDKFVSWALGDLLRLLSGPYAHRDTQFAWQITEIDFETVRENRRYHHTTHEESHGG